MVENHSQLNTYVTRGLMYKKSRGRCMSWYNMQVGGRSDCPSALFDACRCKYCPDLLPNCRHAVRCCVMRHGASCRRTLALGNWLLGKKIKATEAFKDGLGSLEACTGLPVDKVIGIAVGWVTKLLTMQAEVLECKTAPIDFPEYKDKKPGSQKWDGSKCQCS